MVASTLAAGDIAIIAYATDAVGLSDDDDVIRLVLLRPIGSGTQIFFTDRAWNGSAFVNGAGDGTFAYTAGADLAAGTVIAITSAQLAAAGMNLSDLTGDTIYAYQGADADTPTSFLYAADIADGNNVFNGSLANTGLTVGTTAVAVGVDQASYAGPSTQIQATQLAEIGDNVQWHGSDTNDNLGTIYDDRADVSLSGPLNNPDMQLFAVMAGGGQSDAVVRMDNDEASNVATNLTRLFRDNPDFNHLTDLSFDVEDGVFFAVDSDGATTRILKGNIADLASGTSTPTLTVIYNNPNPDQFIGGIEIDTANDKVYLTEGDIFVGHSLKSVGYAGGAVTDYGPVALAVDSSFGFLAGGVFDFTLDAAQDTAYLTYTLVDTFFGPPNAAINYIVKVNSLADPGGGYSVVAIVGSDDPDGPGGNPDNHFPESEGSLAGIDIDIANQTLYFVTQRLGADGTGGIFKLDLATGIYTEIWEQPSNNAFNTLQPFPTTQMQYIEVDTIGGRYYVTTLNSTDTAIGHDGTATDEGGSRIFTGGLADAPGTAPTVFATVFEPTANGAPFGMEIDYAPILTLGSGAGYTEGGPPGDVATSLVVTDPDQAVIKGATVAITAGFTAGDTLSFTPSGGITGGYDAATGVLTLTGNASFAAYQTVLDSVALTAAGDNPTNYGANTSRTVSFTVTDGLINSDPAIATVAVTAVNDAPVNTTGGPIATSEDTAVAVTGLSVSDVDADPAADTISVTLAVTNGTIAVAPAAGVVITGNGTGSVGLSGTQNDINAALAAVNGVTYTPDADFNGSDTLTMTSDDLGNSGAGGAQQDQDQVAITVSAVNDDPTAPPTNSVSTAEDTASGATAIGADDPDNDTLTYSEKPGFEAANGTVTFDQINGTFTYTPDPDYNGSDSFTILIDDGNGGTAEQVVSVTVTPVNDDPTAPATNSVSAAEDAASAATAIGADDVDNDTLTYSEKPGAEAANGTVTFDQINGTFTYTPDPDFNGSDSFTILIDDGNGGTTEQVVSVTVTPVNDAPTVAGDGTEDAAPIIENMPSPTGQSVASLFGGQYSDAADQVAGGSSADAFAGVAVTANGSSPATGQWQYHNGAAWVDIGPASTGAAVLLSASTQVRFNPAFGFVGSAPTLTAHLVDASGGAIVSGTVANLSVTGGTTPYSTGTVTLGQTVIDGNTPPTGVNGTLTVVEDANNGTTVGTVTATDPDSSTFTYTLVNDAGGRFDISTSGVVTVENGLLLDYEQNASHTIRVRVDDNEGGISEFDMNVAITDDHGEFVTGDGANHTYYGGAETDFLFGGHGSDTIRGQGGIDFIFGGNGLFDSTDGGDNLNGGSGSDVILGNGGDDIIAGGTETDVLSGNEGNDTIYGGESAVDAVDTGNDVISGDAGNDILHGNGGNDYMLGGADNDELFGGAGSDDLFGDAGVDRLAGGTGADSLTGGSGFDVFILRKGQANGDVLEDFDGNGSGAGDTIRLEGYAAGTTFTKLGGDTWRINDHGFIEFVTIHADGNVHSTDWAFFP